MAIANERVENMDFILQPYFAPLNDVKYLVHYSVAASYKIYCTSYSTTCVEYGKAAMQQQEAKLVKDGTSTMLSNAVENVLLSLVEIVKSLLEHIKAVRWKAITKFEAEFVQTHDEHFLLLGIQMIEFSEQESSMKKMLANAEQPVKPVMAHSTNQIANMYDNMAAHEKNMFVKQDQYDGMMNSLSKNMKEIKYWNMVSRPKSPKEIERARTSMSETNRVPFMTINDRAILMPQLSISRAATPVSASSKRPLSARSRPKTTEPQTIDTARSMSDMSFHISNRYNSRPKSASTTRSAITPRPQSVAATISQKEPRKPKVKVKPPIPKFSKPKKKTNTKANVEDVSLTAMLKRRETEIAKFQKLILHEQHQNLI